MQISHLLCKAAQTERRIHDAIEIRNLTKSFRGLYAVDHLNMTVPAGAIYGLIGGAIADLPFNLEAASANGIVMCLLSKILLMGAISNLVLKKTSLV